jgi:hypothetical protein
MTRQIAVCALSVDRTVVCCDSAKQVEEASVCECGLGIERLSCRDSQHVPQRAGGGECARGGSDREMNCLTDEPERASTQYLCSPRGAEPSFETLVWSER